MRLPRVLREWSDLLLATALVAVVAGCTSSAPSSPTAPTPQPVVIPPPVAAPPTVECPAPVVLSTTSSSGTTATFPTPESEGGQAPVTVACTPASGGTFPIGSTEVRCTATDALNQTGSCVFPVNVTRTPQLTKVKFMAYGDSITVGWVATNNPSGTPPYLLRIATEAAYPLVLWQMLEARYTAQDFTVTNEGKGGEKAADAYSRFFAAVNTHQPEVVLILDGYNDLGAGADGIPTALTGVSDMAKHARFRGARVFIGTLSAPTPFINRGLGDSVIRAYNDELKDVARGEGAVLVDVYAATVTNPALYNSDDNRHLSEAGYRKVAETFLAAIRANLEQP